MLGFPSAAMDHASLLQLLGFATARGQQLELLTAQVLARTLQGSESTARLLAFSRASGPCSVCSRAWLAEASANGGPDFRPQDPVNELARSEQGAGDYAGT